MKFTTTFSLLLSAFSQVRFACAAPTPAEQDATSTVTVDTILHDMDVLIDMATDFGKNVDVGKPLLTQPTLIPVIIPFYTKHLNTQATTSNTDLAGIESLTPDEIGRVKNKFQSLNNANEFFLTAFDNVRAGLTDDIRQKMGAELLSATGLIPYAGQLGLFTARIATLTSDAGITTIGKSARGHILSVLIDYSA